MRGTCQISRSSDIVVVLDAISSIDPISPKARDVADNIRNELLRDFNVLSVVSLNNISTVTNDDHEVLRALERTADELGAIVILVTNPGQRHGLAASLRRSTAVYIYVLPAILFEDPVTYTRCLVLALVHAELMSLLRFQAPIFGTLYAASPAAVAA